MSDGWLDSTSVFHRCRSAHCTYMRKRSPAQMFASSPPSAPRISTITFLPALGSFGTSSSFSRVSSSSRRISSSSISERRYSFISGSVSPVAISRASASCALTARCSR